MKLTVLGKYGPYPAQNGGTTSYLMECGGKRVLIDAGSGCLARVQNFCALDKIDMIVLTHLHSDHCCEMFILRYALRAGCVVPVLLPRTPEKEFDILNGCACFDCSVLGDKQSMVIPDTDVRLEFCRTVHTVECYALKIRENKKTFVFSGDACISDELTSFCAGADVLLCDSGFLSTQKRTSMLPHMYAAEAAELARTAKAKKLLLTHINPTYAERDILREAEYVFARTEIVKEMRQYNI
ncbi:MAG: MBL fold metallo-hydrolase [Christensenella sp.]